MLLLLALLVSLSLGVPTPFKINVQNSVLEDLQKRLELARYPDSLQDDKNWTTGTDLNYLKSVVEYWKTKYDWRQQEEKLNQMPQFTTTIGDQVVHFVHARSKYPNAKPLLMVHGWPGSFFEFSKILPMLLDPVPYGGTEEDAFHVVSPSIPGYGFSSGKKKEYTILYGTILRLVS
jgi:microsomal epoxide hydrolase